MMSSLLATKFYIPPAHKNLVPRPRLVQQLNEAWEQENKLILISASAGYGKTTLIADWLRMAPVKSAWLSLDATDNDPARFLAYFITALRQIDEHIGQTTRPMLQSPQPLPAEVVQTSLINEIAQLPASFILVLDDYQVIQAMPVHQHLSFLVDHLPPPLHLVIITREDPPLPLARLRARGQLLEIRRGDLRFSVEECADFLQRMIGVTLSAEDIAALEQRTEGWITGLQLAALSMQSCEDLPGFIKAFSGSSHYVLDYLIEEVFEQQTVEVQDFLLRTSILDQLSGPLCDAVADRMGSRSVLERLEHANLFLQPLDQSCTWYRYHHLFADLLRQRLQATETVSESELHCLASQWYSAEGFIPQAIQHALAAGDWERAADLISAHTVEMLARGELFTLLGWLKSLPAATMLARPQLCRDYGWALTLTGQVEAAARYLEQAEADVMDEDAMLGTILVAQAYNHRVRGDYPGAIAYAQRAQPLLSKEDYLSHSLLALTLGLSYWNCGSYPEAEQAFQQVDQAAQQSHNQYARMTALTYLGMIKAAYGRLHDAAKLCERVIQLGGPSPTVAPAHIELGALLYEWNDLDAAAEHTQVGIEQCQQIGNPLIQCDGYRTLAVIQQACEEPEAAQSALQKADLLIENRQVSPFAQIRTAACHVQIALAHGDLAGARFWAERVTGPADTSLLYPCLGLTPVRMSLAQQQKTEAAKELTILYETAFAKQCGAGVIEVLLLQALAAPNPEDALHFLNDALEKAQPEGLIRAFVDKGEPMKALLERVKSRGGERKGYILSLLAAFDKTFNSTSPARSQQALLAPAALIEPLSEREREVLRMLAEGKSNQEIADQLVISIGTVKTHVHNVIEKLGAQSRTQAVARAKKLALL